MSQSSKPTAWLASGELGVGPERKTGAAGEVWLKDFSAEKYF
jgi:hypothetical protein